MRIPKYWKCEAITLDLPEGPTTINCWGGSSVSEEDARQKAIEKGAKISNKIHGSHREFEDYESDIREEILQEISPDAVVTRNRYGSEVLNARTLMFLDIDYVRWSLLHIFNKPDVKAVGIARIRKLAPKYPRLSFRIYETYKGIRAIVRGNDLEAKSRAAQTMMKKFQCDGLYVFLCKKQNCYRARLTPKPFRIRLRKMRFQFPYDPASKPAMEQWLTEYNTKAQKYSTCRFLEEVGHCPADEELVTFHDQKTRALENHPLA